MNVYAAIEMADAILPGVAAPDGVEDPRWQAIIHVSEFMPSEPEAVWSFAKKWGAYPDSDLQNAVATCLIEHLIQHHFDALYQDMEVLVLQDPIFAETVRRCWLHGDGKRTHDVERFRQLQKVASHAAAQPRHRPDAG